MNGVRRRGVLFWALALVVAALGGVWAARHGARRDGRTALERVVFRESVSGDALGAGRASIALEPRDGQRAENDRGIVLPEAALQEGASGGGWGEERGDPAGRDREAGAWRRSATGAERQARAVAGHEAEFAPAVSRTGGDRQSALESGREGVSVAVADRASGALEGAARTDAETAWLVGEVRFEGQGVEGAEVVVLEGREAGENVLARTRSLADGGFRLPVSLDRGGARRVRVRVSAKGAAPLERGVTLRAEQQTEVVFELEAGAEVSIEVEGPDGAPIEGAEVRAIAEFTGGSVAQSGVGKASDSSPGRYRLDLAAGRYRIEVTPPSGRMLAASTLSLALAGGERIERRVRLEPGGVAVLSFVDGGGNPVAGVEVFWSGGAGTGARRARSDQSGRVTLEHLRAGTLSIAWKAPGSPRRYVRVEIVAGRTVEQRLEVEPVRRTIAGVVRGGDGRRLAGAEVRVEDPLSGGTFEAITETDGAFRFELAPSGEAPSAADRVRLTVRFEGEEQVLLVEPPNDQLSVRMQGVFQRYRVRLESPLGAVIDSVAAYAALRLRAVESAAPGLRAAFTGRAYFKDGAHQFVLATGREPLDVVVLFVSGYAPIVVRDLAPVSGVEAPVESIRLMPGARIEGVVRDGDGVPVANASVVAVPAELGTERAVVGALSFALPHVDTDADGRFALTDVPLRASIVVARGERRAESPVELASGIGLRLDLTLP